MGLPPKVNNGDAAIGGTATTAKTAGALPASLGSGRGLSKDRENIRAVRPAIGGEEDDDSDTGAPLFIILGEKDSGKTCGFPGIPRPYGGKTYILSFDRATVPGLLKYYGREGLKERNTVVVDLVSPQYDKDGTMVFEGYNPNRPATALAVVATASAWLDEIEKAGDCDNLLLDHFEALHQDIGRSFAIVKAYGEAGDPLAQLQFQQWGPRKDVCSLLESRARSIARNAVGISGYGAEEKLVMRPKINSQGKEVMAPVKEIVQPRWVGPYKKPYTVTLNHKAYRLDAENPTDGFEKEFRVEVVSSKHPLFHEGQDIDWTGKDYSVFWEAAAEAEKALGGSG